MYNFIDMNETYLKATEAEIKAFESEYGFTFPVLLKEFYIKYGGAELKELEFSMYDNIGFYPILIMPIRNEDVEDSCVKESLEINKVLPGWTHDKFIPFAEDLEGGTAYYWELDTERVYCVCNDNVENPIPICKNIKEFFDILNAAVSHKGKRPYKVPVPDFYNGSYKEGLLDGIFSLFDKKQ